ncbi:MAG: response regulator [Chlorobiaceae bacterium]|nr:response regulator [Chlorobiaceae bacterium]
MASQSKSTSIGNATREGNLADVYAAFYHAPIPIFIIDREGTITDANASFSARYSQLHSRCIGANIFEDMASRPSAKPFYEKRIASIQKVFSTGESASILEFVGGRSVLSGIYPVHSEERKVEKCFIVNQDITSQNELEHRFREQQTHWDITSQSCRLGLWKLDLKTMSIDANAEHDRILGVEPYSIKWTPQSFFDVIVPEDLPYAKSVISDSIANSQDEHLECRIRRPDGSIRWLSVLAKHQFDQEGKPTHLMGVTQDITENKELELKHEELQKQLLQSQKIALIGQLAGGIAHDFNNVLTAIQGNTDMMLNAVDEDHPFRRNLATISSSVSRSAEMVRKLLAFARKQPMNPKNIEPDVELKGMQQMLGKLIRTNISLRWILQCPRVRVNLDPVNLVQIVTNLCVNARDAISENGSISVSTSVIDAEGCDELQRAASGISGEYVRITVSDTGSGIDPHALPHIYEPFFTTKDVGNGTGLGLSTVYGIVKQNNGHIACRTEIGEGTTFEIYFPIVPNADAPVTSTPTQEPPLTGQRGLILLVEDEPDIANIIRIVLENEGFTVFVAKSAEEGLDIVDILKERPCLIISDIMLPGMNGIAMSGELLRRDPTMKFLFISGCSAENLGEFGKFSADTNFISKPFSLIRFIKTVNTTLKQVR